MKLARFRGQTKTLADASLCWENVYETGPALSRHWANASCLLGRRLFPSELHYRSTGLDGNNFIVNTIDSVLYPTYVKVADLFNCTFTDLKYRLPTSLMITTAWLTDLIT